MTNKTISLEVKTEITCSIKGGSTTPAENHAMLDVIFGRMSRNDVEEYLYKYSRHKNIFANLLPEENLLMV